MRHAGSVLVGIGGLGFLMNLPIVYALPGLLSISGFVLSRVLRRLRGNPYHSVNPPSEPIERSLVLNDVMDLTTSWTRTGTHAVILSFVPLIFWNTATAYLELLGGGAALPWFAAFLLTLLPVLLLGVETLRHLAARRWLSREIAGDDPTEPLGPVFSWG